MSRVGPLLSGTPLSLVDGRTALLVPYTHVRSGGTVVTTKIGFTAAHAHRRALLVLAKILEKDLTARYQH